MHSRNHRNSFMTIRAGLSSSTKPQQSKNGDRSYFEDRRSMDHPKKRMRESPEQHDYSIMPKTLGMATETIRNDSLITESSHRVTFTIKKQPVLKKPPDVFNNSNIQSKITNKIDNNIRDRTQEVAAGKVKKKKRKRKSNPIEMTISSSEVKKEDSNVSYSPTVKSFDGTNKGISFDFVARSPKGTTSTMKIEKQIQCKDTHEDIYLMRQPKLQSSVELTLEDSSNLSLSHSVGNHKYNQRNLLNSYDKTYMGKRKSEGEASLSTSPNASVYLYNASAHVNEKSMRGSKLQSPKESCREKSSSLNSSLPVSNCKFDQKSLLSRYDKTHMEKLRKSGGEACPLTSSNAIKHLFNASASVHKKTVTLASGRKSVISQSHGHNEGKSSLSVPQRSFKMKVNAIQSLIPAEKKDDIDMEWEPIEDEKVLINILEQRQRFQENGKTYLDEPLELMEVNHVDFKSSVNDSCVLVLDTNILISHVKFVEQLSEKGHEGLGRPLIVIPWMVLKELDSMKSNRHKLKSSFSALQSNARIAIQFINRCFSSLHPYVKGQSAMEDKEEMIKIEVPDDNIINCCIQLKNKGMPAVLLSNDVNLRNKAIANEILSYGKEQLCRSIESGTLGQPNASLKDLKEIVQQNAEKKPLPKIEKSPQQILVSEFQTLLHGFVSKLLETAMKKDFGDMWLKVVYIKPPWTLLDCFRCLIKHWCAVFCFIMDNVAKSTIEDLLKVLRGRQARNPLKTEVRSMIQSGINLCRAVTSKEYKELVSEYENCFQDLLKNDSNAPPRSSSPVFDQTNSVPVQVNVPIISTDESGNNITFQAFQTALSLVNSFCGILCDIVGVNLGVVYDKPEIFPSVEEVRERVPYVNGCVNSLINSMHSVVEIPANCLSPEHPAIVSLYASLQTVISSDAHISSSLLPENLYSFAANINTRVMLSNGLNQFRELQVLLTKLSYHVLER